MRRLTSARRDATNTVVLASTTSTAHLVPRTAAIACGVKTLTGLPRGLLRAPRPAAPCCSTRRNRHVHRDWHPKSSKRAPFSTTIVMPLSQRQVAACPPPVATGAAGVGLGGQLVQSAGKNTPGPIARRARQHLMPASKIEYPALTSGDDTAPYHTRKLPKSTTAVSYCSPRVLFQMRARSAFSQDPVELEAGSDIGSACPGSSLGEA